MHNSWVHGNAAVDNVRLFIPRASIELTHLNNVRLIVCHLIGDECLSLEAAVARQQAETPEKFLVLVDGGVLVSHLIPQDPDQCLGKSGKHSMTMRWKTLVLLTLELFCVLPADVSCGSESRCAAASPLVVVVGSGHGVT